MKRGLYRSIRAAALVALALGIGAAVAGGCVSSGPGAGTGAGDAGGPSVDGASPGLNLDGGADSTLADGAASDGGVVDSGADGSEATSPEAAADGGDLDATLDGGVDASPDSGPADLDWAQWPMPNPPLDTEGGAPNPESYTAGSGASAGTVTDDVTGLMWQTTPADDAGAFPQVTQAQAVMYCTGLDLAGSQDWRLPTLIELMSIVDFSLEGTSSVINPTYFPGTPSTAFLTSTGSILLEFAAGTTSVGGGTFPFRCVRGGVGPFASAPILDPPGRFTVTGSGAGAAVFDTKTTLTWQQTPTSDAGTFPLMTQAAAEAYCAATMLGGQAARLPTVSELMTLVDWAAGVPKVDAVYFPATPANYFATATRPGTPGFSWVVDFYTGASESAGGGGVSVNVRCVR